MARKTLKSLGIPKGYQLTNNNKYTIAEYVCKLTCTDEAYSLSDAEVALFKDIMEHCFPAKTVEEYILQSDTAQHLFSKQFCRREKNVTFISSMCITGSTTTHIGLDIAWGSDAYTVRGVSSSFGKKYFEKDVRVKVPALRITDILLDDLPDTLIKRVEEHVQACTEFNSKTAKLRSSLLSVLNNYTSVLKLCTDNPEFVQWIRGSVDLEPDPGTCSDIPIADKMQEIKQIVGD
jgi:hypothetical protein